MKGRCEMKIYKHEYNSFKKRVETIEIEVEEKPKTYVVTERVKGVWETRIHKEEIDKLCGRYGYRIFTFTPDTTGFINAIIQSKECCIKNLKERLQCNEEEKTILLKLLDEKR